ncbi:hypothetical protein GCM10009735_76870 [Actinomadura chokoriensis]
MRQSEAAPATSRERVRSGPAATRPEMRAKTMLPIGMKTVSGRSCSPAWSGVAPRTCWTAR